ncbi:hypothetical protein H4W29_006577 [Rhizobium viscosum]|uniref:Uncharacterized protein n=1 Tax=Rhizobium viscosum TaxID=1673 RepID=A0ABR9J1M9_RHIVS|nr:hypothetical protein [Rhizobium viscosum]
MMTIVVLVSFDICNSPFCSGSGIAGTARRMRVTVPGNASKSANLAVLPGIDALPAATKTK